MSSLLTNPPNRSTPFSLPLVCVSHLQCYVIFYFGVIFYFVMSSGVIFYFQERNIPPCHLVIRSFILFCHVIFYFGVIIYFVMSSGVKFYFQERNITPCHLLIRRLIVCFSLTQTHNNIIITLSSVFQSSPWDYSSPRSLHNTPLQPIDATNYCLFASGPCD